MSLIMWKYGTPQFHWLAHFSLDISYSLHRIGRRCYGLQTYSDQPLFEQAGSAHLEEGSVNNPQKKNMEKVLFLISSPDIYFFISFFWCMYIYIYLYISL